MIRNHFFITGLIFSITLIIIFALIMLSTYTIDKRLRNEHRERRTQYESLYDLVKCKNATESATISEFIAIEKVLRDKGEMIEVECK